MSAGTELDNKTAWLPVPDEWVAAFGMVIFAFAMRYWFFYSYPSPLMLHEQDGTAYMYIARDLLAFKAPENIFMPPFYPLLIAIFSVLPIKFELAARIASITMDALVVLPLYGLSRIVLPRLASLVVCGLRATFAFCLIFTPSPLSQSTYLCMLLTGTYLLCRGAWGEQRGWQFFLAGAAFACAYLTRPEGLVTVAVGLAFIGLALLQQPDARRRLGLGAALFLLGFFVCALPFVLLLHARLGHWTFTAKTTVAIKGIDGALTLGQGADQAKNGLALWLDQVGGLGGGIKFIWGNVLGFMTILLRSYRPWMHWLALLGLPLLLIGKQLSRRLFLLIPFLATIPVYIANLPKVHAYIYPLFPLYFLAVVAGSWKLLSLALDRGAAGQSRLAALKYGVLLALAVVIAFGSYHDAVAHYTSDETRYQVYLARNIFQPAGEDLQRISQKQDIVMTRWGLITYFADRPLVSLPKGNIDEVIAHGRNNKVKYLVIDTESVLVRRQELLELLNPLHGRGINPRYGLQVVAVRGQGDLGGYVIYRYLP